MRHVALTFTLDDLCGQHTRDQIEIMADALVPPAFEESELHHGILLYLFTRVYVRAAAVVLREIWVRKLFFLRRDFSHLEDLLSRSLSETSLGTGLMRVRW